MLARIRTYRFTSLFWCLTLVQLLNVAVDPPDMEAVALPEDLSYNDPESILEIVVEDMLGYEDALPEHDDNDSEREGKLSKTTSFDTFPPPAVGPLLPLLTADGSGSAPLSFDHWQAQYYQEIAYPPPEA